MTEGFVVAEVVRAVAAALLHSLWQGGLIAACVAVAMHLLRHHSAQARYVVACAGLVAMVGAWVLTAHAAFRAPHPVAASAGVVSPSATEAVPPVGGAATPAIRIFSSSDELEASVGPRTIWRQRLEAWSVTLVPFWLAGVVLLTARLLVSCVGLARLRRRPFSPVSRAVDSLTADVAGRLGITRLVRVVEVASVNVPVVVGWLTPVVMLPASALTGLSSAQLESILAHELAHVRRHDVLVNGVQTAIEVVLFYHPACWWISKRIRVEREHCCDDIAVAACGDEVVYASALADLESSRSAARLAMSATDGPLFDRVRRILTIGNTSEHTGRALPAAVLTAVVIVLAAGALAARPSPADRQSATPTSGRSIPAGVAVLQGRVVEAGSARPVAGVRVQAMSLNGTFEATTSADGRYEIASMPPGSYTVATRAQDFVDGYYGRGPGMAQDFGALVIARGGQITRNIDVRVQPAGRVSGRIFDAKGDGLAGVEIELVRAGRMPGDFFRGAVAFAQTEEDGVYDLASVPPGDYLVRAYVARHTIEFSLQRLADATGTPDVFASTFYPGVADEKAAQPLRVDAGQELPGVDFALATTSLFKVAGSIVDETGDSFDGWAVRLVPFGSGGRDNAATAPSPIDAKGRFEVPDVVPGTYLVHLVQRSAKPGPPPPGALSRLVAPSEPLTVVDADVSNVEVRVTPPALVSLSLTADRGVTRTFAPASVGFSLARPVDGGMGFRAMGFGKVLGRNGAEVEMPVASGEVSFDVETPSGWMVKSISLDGRDATEGPVQLAAGQRDVEVVLTDRVSGVAGVVVDRRGRPMPNYSVVVFPPDPVRWHAVSRAIRDQRTDNDGRFRIDSLPPGTYRAVAVPALRRDAIRDAAVLGRLRGSSEEIRVAEGQRLAVSIRASALPDGLMP